MAAHFFEEMCFPALTQANFDQEALSDSSQLTCVFFWGPNCPNCDIAKKNLLEEKIQVQGWPLRWFNVNAYEESDLATRFGLYGIPVFIFFRNGKNLGRVTSFPGFMEFEKVVQKLLNA